MISSPLSLPVFLSSLLFKKNKLIFSFTYPSTVIESLCGADRPKDDQLHYLPPV